MNEKINTVIFLLIIGLIAYGLGLTIGHNVGIQKGIIIGESHTAWECYSEGVVDCLNNIKEILEVKD